RDVEPRVLVLLVWQLDVEADREPAALVRAAVRGLHRAGASAGHHRPARPGEEPRGLACRLVHRRSLAHARRSEDRDGRPADLLHRAEAVVELLRDQLDMLAQVVVLGREDAPVFHHNRCCGTCVCHIPRTSSAATATYAETIMNASARFGRSASIGPAPSKRITGSRHASPAARSTW